MTERTGRRTAETASEIDLKDGLGAPLLLADPVANQTVTIPRSVVAEPIAAPTHIKWWLGKQPTTRKLTDQCLLRFLRLSEKSDKEIIRFARTWGPLGLCRHGLPAPCDRGRLRGTPCQLVIDSDATGVLSLDQMLSLAPVYQESIAAWRHHARAMNAIHEIVFSLRNDGPIHWDTWEAALQLASPPPEPHTQRVPLEYPEGKVLHHRALPSSQDGPWLVRQLLDRLIRVAGLHIAFSGVAWNGGQTANDPLGFTPRVVAPTLPILAYEYDMEMPTPSLYGALACRLIASLSRGTGQRHCEICKDPIVPTKARSDRANLCDKPECKKAREAEMTRRRRAQRKMVSRQSS